MTTTLRTTTGVRTVTPADHADVTAALSGAFYDDPVFRWIYPDDARRQAVLPDFFAVFTAAIGRHGVSQALGHGIGGALWVPPGEAVVEEAEAEAFVEGVLALAPEDAERGLACFTLLEEHHPHEPAWYLNLLGVVPEEQGKGHGGAMLRAATERCDRDGSPAYLEATSLDNRRLYERHGFRVVEELVLPDGGPSLWAMWREPQS
jgi:GNAT superfamily N-acetyltransferase